MFFYHLRASALTGKVGFFFEMIESIARERFDDVFVAFSKTQLPLWLRWLYISEMGVSCRTLGKKHFLIHLILGLPGGSGEGVF